MFGVIKRRENIYLFVNYVKELKLMDEVSFRFFIGLVL